MIERVPPATEPGRRHVTLIATVLGVGAVGALDLVTGAEVGVSLLYPIPVAVASWRLGPVVGVVEDAKQ